LPQASDWETGLSHKIRITKHILVVYNKTDLR